MYQDNLNNENLRNVENMDVNDNIIESTMGVFDTDGVNWTEREFSHPERTIRIATSFSGIGAPEMALKRLDLKSQIVFACDIGERYLTYPYNRIRDFIKDFTDEDKENFVKSLYDGNKEDGNNGLTLNQVRNDILGDVKVSGGNLLLNKDCLDLIMKYKGITGQVDIEKFIDSLYDEKGENYVKASFFANHDIEENAWHTDIYFMDTKPYKGKVDLYVGGSPCQSYSRSGKRLALNDMRGTLFYEFAKRIEECEPKVFIFENVKGMMDAKPDEKSGFQAALEVFSGLGYNLHWQVLDGQNYGVPQHRERIWVIGIRKDIDIDFKYPAAIPLTKCIKDYLDIENDINPETGLVNEPYLRNLTGNECLKLMGFPDFKVAPEIQKLDSPLKRERILCEQAGNSMVVECLMAIYKQLDITRFGEGSEYDEIHTIEETESINETNTINEMKEFDNVTLESMSVSELSDLMVRVSAIMNKKLNEQTYEIEVSEEKEEVLPVETVEMEYEEVDDMEGGHVQTETVESISVESATFESKPMESEVETDVEDNKDEMEDETISRLLHVVTDDEIHQMYLKIMEEDDDSDVWEVGDFELMELDEPESPKEVMDVKILDEMDMSGEPVKKIMVVGGKLSEKQMKVWEKKREKCEKKGGDLMNFYLENGTGSIPQWDRVISHSGICHTITKTAPPVVLISNALLN